jgi:hypothetical protein
VTLAEALQQPAHDEPKFNPRTEYDGSTGYIQTRGLPLPPTNYDDLLREFKYDPREVRIVGGSVKQTRWQQKARGEDAVWLTAYRFTIAPAATASMSDVLDLIKRRRPVSIPGPSSGRVFRFLAGDMQLGKIDGDGTAGTVDALLGSIDKAVAVFKGLRRRQSIGKVHIAWLGDCGEGNQSQGGANMWRTELTVTEQYRLFRRLHLYAIDAFRPYAEIESDTVNGNHDDVQRGIRTRPDDGHATESAIGLADALALNPSAYGNVRLFVPAKDEAYLTRESGSSIVTMSHGHQWRRGKAWEWWAGQALNLQAPAASQFLFHGHEHELNVRSIRDRTVICVPSLESESSYWRQSHGTVGRRGVVILTTHGDQFGDLQVV